jgi:hypothetical protein
LLPKSVPAFCTTSFDRVVEFTELESILTTAATVMARRGRALTPVYEDLYRSLFAATAPERKRTFRETPRPRLRKVA